MGGPSGPTLLSRIAAIRAKGVGPEGPPTVGLACAARPVSDHRRRERRRAAAQTPPRNSPR
ncbi:DUF6053 domain-containing protein [Lysobacter enzymogenes]|uniref:DUF6053 domain-containing protein n=1 Tax=Lysobacter enzymogenes TaxID=69 RepID=UPI003D1893B8